VTPDDALADRQADPRTRVVLAPVEALEHLKDAVGVLGI
jgi:hypothetical protein